MGAIQIETKTETTCYVTFADGVKAVVKNEHNIPNVEKLLKRTIKIMLHANWDHTIDKIFLGKKITSFHSSWFDPSSKGGIAMFITEPGATIDALVPKYGLVLYDGDRGEKEFHIFKVSSTSGFI